MCGLARRWARCSLKKPCMTGARTRSSLVLQRRCRHAPRRWREARRGLEIPVGVGRYEMSEVGREHRQLALYVEPATVPVDEGLNGKAVPEVVHARRTPPRSGNDRAGVKQIAKALRRLAGSDPPAAAADEKGLLAGAAASDVAKSPRSAEAPRRCSDASGNSRLFPNLEFNTASSSRSRSTSLLPRR